MHFRLRSSYVPVLLCILFAFFLCRPLSAIAAVSIDDMSVQVKMTNEDRIIVTEKFKATISSDFANHGIYRTIPLEPRFEGFERQNVTFKVLAVFIDGKPFPIDDVKQITGGVAVYLRDKANYLAKGPHDFLLRYEVTQQVAFFEDHDELTWNAVGSQWENGVGKASCLVTAPPGADINDTRAWTGAVGSKESEVEKTQGKTQDGLAAVLYRTKGSVHKGQDFTVAVSLPKGHIAEPVPYRPEEDMTFTLVCAGCLLLVSLTTFIIWLQRCRESASSSTSPSSNPPLMPERLTRKGRKNRFLSAATVNFLCRDKDKSFSSLLLQLQAKGRLSIEKNANGGYFLTKEAGDLIDFEPLSAEEEAAMKEFRKPVLNMDRKKDAMQLFSMQQASQQVLQHDFPGRGIERRPIEKKVCLAVSWLCLAFVWNWHKLAVWNFTVNTNAIAYATTAFLLVAAIVLLAAFAPIPSGWGELKKKYIMAPLLGVVASMFATSVPWSSPLQQALVFGMLVLPLLCVPFMDKQSRELAEINNQAKGFSKYLKASNPDSLKLANRPREDAGLFARLLPYAIALDAEKPWRRRFAGNPTIRYSSAGKAFIPMWQQELERKMRRAYKNWFSTKQRSSSPSSVFSTSSSGSTSSFSSGGGGSGSGGGGGGGGGC